MQVSGSLCKATVRARSGLAHGKKVPAQIQDANRTLKLADKCSEPNRHRSGVTEAEGTKSLWESTELGKNDSASTWTTCRWAISLLSIHSLIHLSIKLSTETSQAEPTPSLALKVLPTPAREGMHQIITQTNDQWHIGWVLWQKTMEYMKGVGRPGNIILP